MFDSVLGQMILPASRDATIVENSVNKAGNCNSPHDRMLAKFGDDMIVRHVRIMPYNCSSQYETV